MDKESPEKKNVEEGLLCPECGQFLGPMNVCPYCRTKVKGRVDIKTLKAMSILLAVVGVGLLLVWANLRGPAEMNLGDITKRQNYAFIEINGMVVGDARYYTKVSDNGEVFPYSLSFTVDDGTGQLRVKAYDEVTKDIIEKKNIPTNGDRVKVWGNVNYRGNNKFMTLQSADLIDITDDISEKEPEYILIDDIYDTDEQEFETGQAVILEGTFPGPTSQEDDYGVDMLDIYDNLKIVLKDAVGNAVAVHVPNALLLAYGEMDVDFTEGISLFDVNTTSVGISVTGHLVWDDYTSLPGSEYRGSWILVVQDFDALELGVVVR